MQPVLELLLKEVFRQLKNFCNESNNITVMWLLGLVQ